MRVVLIGSLPASAPLCISANIQKLICGIAKRGDRFVIRASRRANKATTPVDEIVSGTLQELEASGELQPDRSRLTVIREPGVGSDLQVKIPHLIHQAATSYRIDFYREILTHVDLVVGVGGELGLLRLAMVCEQSGKPVFCLPGSGGTAEFLWDDYFQKSSQLLRVSSEDIDFLKGTPRADIESPTYADDVYRRLTLVHETIGKTLRHTGVVSADSVALGEFASALGQLSVGVWITMLGLIASVVSFSYWLGTLHLFN